MVTATIMYLYDYTFALINLASIALFFLINYTINEWRARYARENSLKDQGFNQKAIDSLLNFETVKYFNAEDFEEFRF
jgi:ATP-binding cassette, subfamily B, heavy metal transporter